MGKHAWITTTLIDMAAYAEMNNLFDLHAELCNVAVTAALLSSDEEPGDEVNQEPATANLISFPTQRRRKLEPGPI
ncbi:hypothetical protein [Defluviimonas salinarum]|uniref:Uncharacterized protein n=1 Tax=Defluviimonas salinarum TaxID=2992147 RepID=A0ABT3JAR2_9RHOB|nr:hypothetical protein [Defluviimonas salinarum]MCW3784766.1 hypothetical protein [Defluviimonas salinarum]